MNYLFIHQNFPAQYRHVVRHLASQPGNKIYFITQPNENSMAGVYKVMYPKDQRESINCHAYTIELDRAIHTGATVAEVCRSLQSKGFTPDLVVGHCGWGETLFVKDVLPDVPLLANFEFYYHSHGVDVGFDPEFLSIFQVPSRLRTRNAISLMSFQSADWGHSATRWQKSLYPAEMQARISVLHEGVDTDTARPNPKATFTLPATGQVLTRHDEVVTYVSRNLEPYRGFHVFMRALPQLLRRRKRARVVIVGGDEVSYGAPPPPRSTFREMMLQEVGGKLDLERVHFVGIVDYARYLNLLQISSAHVYLTYPFVLSWSFIEALACGCVVIGSDTAPVQEVLQDGINGLMVDFFSHKDLAIRIENALEEPEAMLPLRRAARATAVNHFDLNRVLLPRWSALFDDLVNGRQPRDQPGDLPAARPGTSHSAQATARVKAKATTRRVSKSVARRTAKSAVKGNAVRRAAPRLPRR
jgi:glycosyltransferase involved in cell wall biosynthesis